MIKEGKEIGSKEGKGNETRKVIFIKEQPVYYSDKGWFEVHYRSGAPLCTQTISSACY